MTISATLRDLVFPHTGQVRLVSSQNRQPPSGMMARIAPHEPTKMVTVAPRSTLVLADLTGPGQIVRIWMTTLSLPGAKVNMHHAGLLRFYWDGEATPSVEAPFGAFFGVPWGKYTPYTAEPMSCTSGGYLCAFPMPFDNSARIEVFNESDTAWEGLFYQIEYEKLEEAPSALRFHAQYRRETHTPYRTPYTVLDAAIPHPGDAAGGHFAGMHLFMQNSEWWLDLPRMRARWKKSGSLMGVLFPEMLGMGMLEGWERIYVDNEPLPSISGTGTEDYFNSGFYFSKGTFSAPHWGCTVRDYFSARCAAYRFHINDPIPFQRSLRVEMDHGYTNQVQTDYASVAYWYQSEPHAAFPLMPSALARQPASVDANRLQMALFTSPIWIPAAMLLLRGGKKKA